MCVGWEDSDKNLFLDLMIEERPGKGWKVSYSAAVETAPSSELWKLFHSDYV